MPQMTPARTALGCCNFLTIAGGITCGIYMGINNARGIDITPSTHLLMKYGPSIIGGFLGFTAGTDIAHDSSALDEMVPQPYNIPEESREQARDQMKGCYQGCGPIASTIAGAGITGIGTFVGYMIGNSLG